MTGVAVAPYRGSRLTLVASLLALAALYVAWFALHDGRTTVLAFTALPPALLAIATALRLRTAGFWAAVLALAWFCHGVMTAWASADERVLALLETAIARKGR